MFEIRKDGFYLNGKKFRLFSGAMHYFRVPKAYWDDRLSKLRACGFNCVETVVPWNFHEVGEGKFDFTGARDIAEYCAAARRNGLYIIIRPGPYICGEWEFGGFPPRLLADKNLRLRCGGEPFLSQAQKYIEAVVRELTPLQITRGGNLIAMQVENEYGSYGNDKRYLRAIEETMRKNGIEIPLFTSDGTDAAMLSGGTLRHLYTTLNFGSRAEKAFDSLIGIQEDMPKTCMEFWCGWFDHWGERHHRRRASQVAREVEKLVSTGANINIYMLHGGTNFGFWAGANYAGRYLPTVTSYDDAALLNEFGDYTPAYRKIRKILFEAQGLDLSKPLPPSPKLQKIGTVKLTDCADLWVNLYRLGQKRTNSTPESMERFGQDRGFILYRTVVKGKYGASKLYVEGVHDVAYVRINGKLAAKYYRTSNVGKMHNDGFVLRTPAFDETMTIEILVEAMGRINYGSEMENDRKGIQKVKLGYQTLFGWDAYSLPMEDMSGVDWSAKAAPSSAAIMRGKFRAKTNADCFVDMKGFRKGFVLVNGINLGRYWAKGPQRSLYLPAPFLKDGDNEIIVVEQERSAGNELRIGDKHYL